MLWPKKKREREKEKEKKKPITWRSHLFFLSTERQRSSQRRTGAARPSKSSLVGGSRARARSVSRERRARRKGAEKGRNPKASGERGGRGGGHAPSARRDSPRATATARAPPPLAAHFARAAWGCGPRRVRRLGSRRARAALCPVRMVLTVTTAARGRGAEGAAALALPPARPRRRPASASLGRCTARRGPCPRRAPRPFRDRFATVSFTARRGPPPRRGPRPRTGASSTRPRSRSRSRRPAAPRRWPRRRRACGRTRHPFILLLRVLSSHHPAVKRVSLPRHTGRAMSTPRARARPHERNARGWCGTDTHTQNRSRTKTTNDVSIERTHTRTSGPSSLSRYR